MNKRTTNFINSSNTNDDNKCINRRNFIKLSSTLGAGLCVSGISLLTSCSNDNTLSPFKTGYKIHEELCTGCGKCLPSCHYNAIILPQKTLYSIDTASCTSCGKCLTVCPESAILVTKYTYDLITEECIGCGKCIDKCKNEADCISWEKETYTVRNKCKPNNCHKQCLNVCEYGAITIGDKCIIDSSKCTKCGKCVGVCPVDAINPAKVEQDKTKCTNCGECFPVCEFDTIKKIKPENFSEPKINSDLCTSCGKCQPICSLHDAIKWQLFKAKIDRNLCVDCGKCVPFCNYDAIKKVEI